MSHGYSFRCPKCGGYFFGTRWTERNVEDCIGHCDGTGCKFEWSRSEDHKVFTEPDGVYFEEKFKESEAIKNELLEALKEIQRELCFIYDEYPLDDVILTIKNAIAKAEAK